MIENRNTPLRWLGFVKTDMCKISRATVRELGLSSGGACSLFFPNCLRFSSEEEEEEEQEEELELELLLLLLLLL